MTSKKAMNPESLEDTDEGDYSDQKVPKGWQHVSVGEILTLKRGYDLPKQDRQDGIFPIFAANGIVGTHSKYMARAPGVVTGRSGTIGKVYVIEEDFWPLNTALYVKDFHGNDPNFIAWLLRHLDLTQFNSSTAVPSLNRNIVHKHTSSIPPLAEQIRIVSKIESLQARSTKTRALLAEVKPLIAQLRQSVLRSAFNGSLTADWRAKQQEADTSGSTQIDGAKHETASELLHRIRIERRERWDAAQLAAFVAKGKEPSTGWRGKYKEPEPVNETGLLELPEGWCWATWEAILADEKGAFKRGPFGSALKKSMFVNAGYKVYEQYCPINDDCSFARYYITSEKFDELRAFAVKANDFLVSCSGTLGRITQVPEIYENGVINQALLRVRIDNDVISDLYFKWLFRSPFFQKNIFDNATGSAIPNVKGVKELKAMPIPIPPLKEQNEIVHVALRALNGIDILESTLEHANSHIENIDQSILSKAFRGELVPQDPNDEPASELLARIQAAREADATTKNSSKKKTPRRKKKASP